MAHVLIDGYNLLAISGHADRDALVADLGKYRKIKGHAVTVVFDGTHGGTGRGDHGHHGGIEVVFTPLTVTADDVIEQMLAQRRYPDPIVVSSDRRIQNAARRAHTAFAYAHEFASRLRKKADEGFDADDQDDSPRKGEKLPKDERRRRARLKKL